MNLHHGHGDLFEIGFEIAQVGERLSAENYSKPRAQLVLPKKKKKNKNHKHKNFKSMHRLRSTLKGSGESRGP